MLSLENIAYYPLDPFFYEKLAKTKDTSAFGQVAGEYGLVVAYDKSHGAIKEFSSTFPNNTTFLLLSRKADTLSLIKGFPSF